MSEITRAQQVEQVIDRFIVEMETVLPNLIQHYAHKLVRREMERAKGRTLRALAAVDPRPQDSEQTDARSDQSGEAPADPRGDRQAVSRRDGWRGLASWMRAPGTIDREDAIDSCARAVENYAEYQFQKDEATS